MFGMPLKRSTALRVASWQSLKRFGQVAAVPVEMEDPRQFPRQSPQVAAENGLFDKAGVNLAIDLQVLVNVAQHQQNKPFTIAEGYFFHRLVSPRRSF
jgi:hypothetical protein